VTKVTKIISNKNTQGLTGIHETIHIFMETHAT